MEPFPYNSPPLLCTLALYFCFLSSSSPSLLYHNLIQALTTSTVFLHSGWHHLRILNMRIFVWVRGCQPPFSTWSTRVSVVGKSPKACLVARLAPAWLSGSLMLASPIIQPSSKWTKDLLLHKSCLILLYNALLYPLLGNRPEILCRVIDPELLLSPHVQCSTWFGKVKLLLPDQMRWEGMLVGFRVLLLWALLRDQLLAPAALLPLSSWKKSTQYRMNGRVGRPQGQRGQGR